MLARRALAALAVLLAADLAAAQPGPRLDTVFPPGAKAGETVEVTVTGVGFDGDEKLVFPDKGFEAERVGAATVDPKAPKGAPATSSVKFKVTVPKDATPTVTDVRVASKGGISNPRAFVVSHDAEANEAEPNNDVGQAQKIELNTTANGVISAPTDVDYVKFTAKAGQNVVVYCLSTSIDSKLSADILVATPDGKRLAENRNYRGGDAVLDFKAPSDGEYLVRVAQFAYSTGGVDHFYRLTVTTGPWVDAVWPPVTAPSWTLFGRSLAGAEPAAGFTRPDGRPFDALPQSTVVSVLPPPLPTLSTDGLVPPAAAAIDATTKAGPPADRLVLTAARPPARDNDDNDTPEKAQTVKLPADVAGRIDRKNDRDWYSFDAKKGDVWTLEVFADRLGSQVDAFFTLTDDKGKVIVEADDGPPTLSPNQFFTTSDDPARYRFAVPADGTYRVMVSARDAGVQSGVREQYVLRIAKEKPDFRLAVMPVTPHLPDATTLPKGGAAMLAVFVFRQDGFDGPITLVARGLPPGVSCSPQVVGPGQTRALLVLTADRDAEDWEGYVRVTGSADRLTHQARPFTVVWTPAGIQANQPPPNAPMLTRMDRAEGPALAVRGSAPFSLTPTETEFTARAGGRVEVTLRVERDPKFKDAIQVFNATAQTQPGGKQPAALATIPADKTEVKVMVDVPSNLPPGPHPVVLRGQSAAPPPKQPNNAVVRPVPQYPAAPITVTVEGKETPKKK